MLNIALAETLVHDRQQELRAGADRARNARTLRRARRGLRARAGWWLIRTGTRLAGDAQWKPIAA